MGTKKHETGAVRSTDSDDVRFDLISPIALRRLAKRYKEGADKYGDNNWLKGFKASDLLNHVLNHLNLYMTGDDSDGDNLAAAVWGLSAIMTFEETQPYLIDIPARRDKEYNGISTLENLHCKEIYDVEDLDNEKAIIQKRRKDRRERAWLQRQASRRSKARRSKHSTPKKLPISKTSKR